MPERMDKTDAIPMGAANPFAQFVDSKIPGRSYFESTRQQPEHVEAGDLTQVIPIIPVDRYNADAVSSPAIHNSDQTEFITRVNVNEGSLPWRTQEVKAPISSTAIENRNHAQVDRKVLEGSISKPKNKLIRYGSMALVATSLVGLAGIKLNGSDEVVPNATAMVGIEDSKKLDPAKFIPPALDCAKPGELRTRLSARAESDILIPIDTKRDASSLTQPVGYPMFKDGVNGAPEGMVELNNVEICFDENKAAKKKNGTLKPYVSLAKNPKNKNEYIATIHRDLAIPVPKIPLGNCDPKDVDGNAIVVCVDDPGATGLLIGASTAKGIDANEAKAANEFVRSRDYSMIAISSLQNFTLRRLTHAPANATDDEKIASQVMRTDIWKALDAQLKNITASELARYGVTKIVLAGDYPSLDRDIYEQYKKSIDDPRVIVDPQVTSLAINTETVK